MMVEELIQPGSKIDITVVQQRESTNGDGPKVYKSRVLDIKENGNIEIAMPSEGSRMILLPLGVRMEFVFYTKGGLYRSIGQIKERYKSENIYMLEIELNTQLEKFQRREFFRYQYLLDFSYYTISQEESEYESAEALFVYLRESGLDKERENNGSIVDLSGGGIRFRTDTELQQGDNTLFLIRLKNENLNKLYYILGKIIECNQAELENMKKYEVRAKFHIMDNKIREEIIRFIFEEERKERQRGRW